MSPRRPKAIKITVLVVDDHADTRTVYARILEDAGYFVETAENGHEAIVSARRERPQIIFMDLAMPDVDGWEAAQTLKSAPATRDAWLVAVTARCERHDIDRAYASGCDDVALKPIDGDRLLKLVEAGIARRRTRP